MIDSTSSRPVIISTGRCRPPGSSRSASQLSSAAHSLKSSAANLGATDLAALCRDLEQLGREEDMGDVLATLGTLEYEFEAVCEALNDTLGSVQPA